jgi:hypothetical protein
MIVIDRQRLTLNTAYLAHARLNERVGIDPVAKQTLAIRLPLAILRSIATPFVTNGAAHLFETFVRAVLTPADFCYHLPAYFAWLDESDSPLRSVEMPSAHTVGEIRSVAISQLAQPLQS